MLVKLVLDILGVFLFLFIFWKRQKEDYSSDIVFQTVTAVLIGMGVGFLASKLFIPGWFFWTSFAGSLLGMGAMIKKYKLRFYETYESLVLAFMPIVSIMFFKDSISNSSLNSFISFVASLILIFFAYYVDMNYKGYSWYKSGKIGFTGLFVSLLFFLTRSVVAIAGLNMISFTGKIEIVISGILTIGFVFLLINLGRKK